MQSCHSQWVIRVSILVHHFKEHTLDLDDTLRVKKGAAEYSRNKAKYLYILLYFYIILDQ